MNDKFKKFIILLLNVCTGGLGTIIFPFTMENCCNCRNIIIGILIGIVQIIHFVHLLSLIIGFRFITNFYDIIAGENILTPFMSDKYKEFLSLSKNVSETLEKYIPDDINEMFVINPDDILSMKLRISFIKIILMIISGLSYINSCLTPLINLIKDNEADFKMLTYGIFNPGAGAVISAILFFNTQYCKIIISLIGVLIGILLMTCPFVLGIGLYLMKIINNIINFFPFKIILIFIGASDIFILLCLVFYKKIGRRNIIMKQKDILILNVIYVLNIIK